MALSAIVTSRSYRRVASTKVSVRLAYASLQLTAASVQVVQITLSIENGISTTHDINSSAVQLGDGQIKDMKFSESVLLILWESEGQSPVAPSNERYA